MIIIHELKTRHNGLHCVPTGWFHAPRPHYWIRPENAGCISHRNTYHSLDVTPHSMLRCLWIILTAEHKASNWQLWARKEISRLVRRWVFINSLLKPANDASLPPPGGTPTPSIPSIALLEPCKFLVFFLLLLRHNYQWLPSTCHLKDGYALGAP